MMTWTGVSHMNMNFSSNRLANLQAVSQRNSYDFFKSDLHTYGNCLYSSMPLPGPELMRTLRPGRVSSDVLLASYTQDNPLSKKFHSDTIID
jgi:hypothetical protein